MTRAEIESRIKKLFADIKTRIEAAPLPAFFIGIGIGCVAAIFARVLIPLLLVFCVTAGVFWFLADVRDEQ